LGFLLRAIFWALSFGAGAVSGLIFLPMLLTGRLSKRHIAVKIFILSLVTAVPPLFVNAAFNGSRSVEGWLFQYLLSLVISILVNVSAYTVFKAANSSLKATENSERSGEGVLSPTLQFLERLPKKYHAAKLYAVSSEDHYVQVHTSHGTELILMRLSDVVKELSDVDGLQTHRSWWVAREGIVESVRKNGKYGLVLKSGVTAPVSRSFSKTVRDANYID